MTGDVIKLRDARAEEARVAVLKAISAAKKATAAEIRIGRVFHTEEATTASLKVCVSLREAFSLVRVLGPIGLQNGDGSFTRLFAAMATCQTHLMRAPDGKSLSVVAALQVLQAAINDHLWHCRDLADPPRSLPRRPNGSGRAGKRYKPF